MTSEIKIVPMSSPLVESFWQVLDGVAREGLWLELTAAPPLEKLRKLVADDIAVDNALYVAVDGRKVVGWCAIIRETRQFRTHRGRLAMGIQPESRNRGLGRKLAERCIAHSEATGIGRIELSVYSHNTIAKALYEKLGFEVEGLHRMTRVLDGRYFDTIDMARLNYSLLMQSLGKQ